MIYIVNIDIKDVYRNILGAKNPICSSKPKSFHLELKKTDYYHKDFSCFILKILNKIIAFKIDLITILICF